MPTSIGFASWAALGAAAAAAAAQIVIATAISYAISAVFAKKPSSAGSFGQDAQDRMHTLRNAVAAGRVIFGRIRVGGVQTFVHTSSHTSSQTTPAYHDYVIPPGNPSVFVPSWFADIGVNERVYSPENETYSNVALLLTSGAPGQGQYQITQQGSGATYTFNDADAGKSIQVNFDQVTSTTVSKYLHMIVELACHEVDAIENIYFDNELIPIGANGYADGRLGGGWAYVSKHLGTADQLADASLISFCPDKWTSAHRNRGIAYIYARLLRDVDKFPNGMPNMTADVRGYKPLDVRTGLRVWSDNWALCIAAYLADTKFGLKHAYVDEINDTRLIAAANVSDELVTLASGGTEKRYTCNGSFLTSEEPKDILGRMKVAGSGHAVRIGGKWQIYAGAYITPTVTLTEDSLRGPVHVIPRLSKRDTFNFVKGVYVSESNAWQPADFPVVKNATYLAEDQGEPIPLDMELQYTTSSAMAQRIAKIELERVRQQITVILPCKLSAWTVEPPRTMMLTLAQFGWIAKPFEVSQVDLVSDQDDEGNPYLGVDLTLRETASTVYDWNNGEETTVDPSPDTNLPNPFDVAPPGIPVVREEFYETAGRVAVRLLVDWAASGDGQARSYDLEWKETTSTQFQQHTGITNLHDVIENVSTGLYDVRVRARSAFVTSAWAQARFEVIGLSAPLATPVIEGLQAAGVAILSLEPHPDLRVRGGGGRWRIRHTEDPSAPVWEESFSIGQEQGYPGANTVIVLPLKAGSYLVKAEDEQGHQSAGYASAQTNQASVLTFSPVDLVTEDPGFTGTHTNTVVSAGVLKLDAAGLIDDVADWDSIESLDALGGIELDGTYGFLTGMDFTTVKPVRLISHTEGITVNEFDLIDDRGAPIDDWLDFDGTAGGGSADAWIEIRKTDDNPAGTPTWGPWMRLDASEVICRALEFRLRIITNDPAYNIHIDKLSVVAEEL